MTIGRLTKPVFLVGCMRSGTTLLASILGMHDHLVHCPFELKDIWSQIGGVPMASPKTRDRTCPCLNERDVQPGQAERLTAAFVERMKQNDKNKSENAYFLSKNPHLCNKLPLVNSLFPDARYIWIYRDMPRVVASLKVKLKFHYWPEKTTQDEYRCWEYFANKKIPNDIDVNRYFPNGNVRYLAEYWIENNKAISEFRQRIEDDRMICIKEEELIKNPNRVVKNILRFLQLPTKLSGKIETLNHSRNSLWKQRLNKKDFNDLLEVVMEYGSELNEIFPNKQDLHSLYNNELVSQLKKH
ncbi:sulfotransferase [Halalkalibacter sp. AB-rgal2]|uniref:sulfotransferase family protein n=1 Tax=Halalkalibacter sp. AB-rgal2 TaxID=3242695 RepID=UPI00359E89CD